MLSPEEAQRVLATEGLARGTALLTDRAYVLSRGGEESLRLVEAELARLGTPIEYGQVEDLEWYPIGLRLLSLLAIVKVFQLDKEGLRRMADAAPKRSFIVRLLVQFFLSPRDVVARFPEYWSKHYTIGTLRLEAFEEEEQWLELSVDAEMHPVQCPYLEGYLGRMVRFLFPDKRVTIEETACMFEGAERHVYRATWED